VLRAVDRDNDPLAFQILTLPSHGQLTDDGTNLTYQPAPNYFGPDEFTFNVSDGLLESAPATVALTVLSVNDRPVAASQILATDEDIALPITLGASDADGDALTYTLGAPAHGRLSGTPPDLIYTPAPDYFGADRFAFTVTDPSNAVSQLATVTVTVRPINDAPVARIEIAPRTEWPGVTNLVSIAPVCCVATLRLDASRSTDAENEPLEFAWLHGTNVLSNASVFTNQFLPGTHEITLLVADPSQIVTQTVTVEIITAVEAVELLQALVESNIPDRPEQVPLVNWLREAGKAFAKCKVDQGVRFLEKFQERVRDRVSPADPELGAHLIQTAQSIIEVAADCGPGDGTDRPDHPKKDDDDDDDDDDVEDDDDRDRGSNGRDRADGEDRNSKPKREAGDDSEQKRNSRTRDAAVLPASSQRSTRNER
jgi:hypothetical protein